MAAKVAPRDWQIHLPMPTKRVFSTPVILNDHLYVVGGCDVRGKPLDCFEVYSLKGNTWKTLPGIPTKRAGAAAIAVGNKIVVLGGVSVTQKPLDSVEIYDVDTNTWTTGESMRECLLGIPAELHGTVMKSVFSDYQCHLF